MNQSESIITRCVLTVLSQKELSEGLKLDSDTKLISSGLLDSFNIIDLVTTLEKEFGISIPNKIFINNKNFDTIKRLTEIVEDLKSKTESILVVEKEAEKITDDSENTLGAIKEMSINNIDLGQIFKLEQNKKLFNFWTLLYKLVFTFKGIKFGKNLQVTGPLTINTFLGSGKNIVIGNSVTLCPHVELKVRGNGKIKLYDGVKLDNYVRLISANEAKLSLGEGTVLGMGTVINGGADVTFGKNSIVATGCVINASDHKNYLGTPIKQQGFIHGPIAIGEDVWLAANVVVSLNSVINNGAIIGANSVISGSIPSNAIAVGNPAKVVRMRIDKVEV